LHACFHLLNYPPDGGTQPEKDNLPVTATKSFVIRRTFLIPLGLLLGLTVALMGVCLVQGQPTAKVVILGFIAVPVLALFVESVCRRTVIGREAITVNKCLRRKTLVFADVTEVETVRVRKRVFLTLCAGDDFLILSNAYAGFPALVEALLGRVAPEAVSEETRKMAVAPPTKSTDVISCWLGVALLAFILYIQLGGSF